jgi:hypothetical protein
LPSFLGRAIKGGDGPAQQHIAIAQVERPGEAVVLEVIRAGRGATRSDLVFIDIAEDFGQKQNALSIVAKIRPLAPRGQLLYIGWQMIERRTITPSLSPSRTQQTRAKKQWENKETELGRETGHDRASGRMIR